MTTTLKSTSKLEDAERKQFIADLDLWIVETEMREKTREAAHGNPDAMHKAFAEEETRVAALSKKIRTQAVKAALERRQMKLGRASSSAVRQAERLSTFIGKPAPDFELTGVDGKTVVLKDLRGRVVVLDFWYRDCGWCITAMPQVIELARRR